MAYYNTTKLEYYNISADKLKKIRITRWKIEIFDISC
jgi:hypothetical protein